MVVSGMFFNSTLKSDRDCPYVCGRSKPQFQDNHKQHGRSRDCTGYTSTRQEITQDMWTKTNTNNWYATSAKTKRSRHALRTTQTRTILVFFTPLWVHTAPTKVQKYKNTNRDPLPEAQDRDKTLKTLKTLKTRHIRNNSHPHSHWRCR